MGSGKGGGGADEADQEADIMNKEYKQQQAEDVSQMEKLNAKEMAYLHAQSGATYQNPEEDIV